MCWRQGLEQRITAKSSQLSSVRNDVERAELELEEAKKGLTSTSVSQADTKSVDARNIRALEVENRRLGERLQVIKKQNGATIGLGSAAGACWIHSSSVDT